MENLPSTRVLIDRIKQLLSAKTDKDLAELLGVSRSVLSVWVHRDSPDYALLLETLLQRGVDLNSVFAEHTNNFISAAASIASKGLLSPGNEPNGDLLLQYRSLIEHYQKINSYLVDRLASYEGNDRAHVPPSLNVLTAKTDRE